MNSSVQRYLRRRLFRHSWDSRARNFGAAHLLGPLVSDAGDRERVLLDVGSGEEGVSAFLKNAKVTAVDLKPPQISDAMALQGDIIALPFADRSFQVVSCIDVLEHLSSRDREKAVGELVRVARRALLMTFPCGSAARASDESFLHDCQKRGRTVPDWVREHLKHPFPTSQEVSDWVRSKAVGFTREARIASYYNEPIYVCRLLRRAAARSNLLYLSANLFFGPCFSFMPAPRSDNSYRVMLLATFE